jgi:hypothetical protein
MCLSAFIGVLLPVRIIVCVREKERENFFVCAVQILFNQKPIGEKRERERDNVCVHVHIYVL